MSAESPEIDITFVKAYLDSCMKLETQKRIAEETFNELTKEENQWKQKMSYTAKKQYSRVSILDMIIMAAKGFVHMAHPNGRVCGAKRPKCEAERSHHL